MLLYTFIHYMFRCLYTTFQRERLYFNNLYESLIFSPVIPNCRSANTMFSVEWLGHKVALKANNGKYICTKKNGQLLAVSDSIGKR